MINSIGRSNEGSLCDILKNFKPVILNQMTSFNQKEILLILSGIATEASSKNKQALESSLYMQIFDSFMARSVKNQDITLLSYS